MLASPLRWQDGALLLLDQRALPGEERWLRCERPEQVAEAIRTLAVRGAPAIGIAAAYGVALADARGVATPPTGDEPAAIGSRAAAREAAAELLADARPTAINLRWAVEQARASDDPLAVAHELHMAQDAADRRLAETGAERFEPGDRALTHCNTGPLATAGYGTALGVLRAAHGHGRLECVWVDETRPLLQGARLTAWELERARIPFSVIADAAAGGLMARGLVDRVVVGADRIAANGDVANKVGTYPLAVLAERHDIPFYVAAPLSTIDPDTPDGNAIPIEERAPEEIVADAPAFNPAFDVTPAELVTAIFTEAGALEPPYEEAIAGVR
jgi:methylthioribose-1-phosphate isomerase